MADHRSPYSPRRPRSHFVTQMGQALRDFDTSDELWRVIAGICGEADGEIAAYRRELRDLLAGLGRLIGDADEAQTDFVFIPDLLDLLQIRPRGERGWYESAARALKAMAGE